MDQHLYSQLEVDQSVSLEHSYTQADFDHFARLSGDDNPIHVDPDYSAKTRFGQTVCHGMLLYSTICANLGKLLPGPGVINLHQDLMFTSPTFANMPVSFEIRVAEISDPGIWLSTDVVLANGSFACKGSALVFPAENPLPEPPLQAAEAGGNDQSELRGLYVGQKATLSRAFQLEELRQFSKLTGDTNPINFDSEYARKAGFKDQLVPAGLLGGMISALLGTKLPGYGTMWLKQQYDYWNPAYPGEMLHASVTIERIRPEKDLVNLHTECRNSDNNLVCSGKALVLVRDFTETV